MQIIKKICIPSAKNKNRIPFSMQKTKRNCITNAKIPLLMQKKKITTPMQKLKKICIIYEKLKTISIAHAKEKKNCIANAKNKKNLHCPCKS